MLVQKTCLFVLIAHFFGGLWLIENHFLLDNIACTQLSLMYRDGIVCFTNRICLRRLMAANGFVSFPLYLASDWLENWRAKRTQVDRSSSLRVPCRQIYVFIAVQKESNSAQVSCLNSVVQECPIVVACLHIEVEQTFITWLQPRPAVSASRMLIVVHRELESF